MFTRISEVLPRFKAYEKLFPHNERLRDNLSKAYLDLLRFLVSVKQVFHKKSPTSMISLRLNVGTTDIIIYCRSLCQADFQIDLETI